MSTLDHLTQRPHRLEHRHRLPGERRAGHGHREADRPRRPLRHRRGLHGGRSTSCGREAGKTAPCCATAPPAASPIPTASTASRTTGPYFRVDAIHLCEPSPQRTPVLYQAGASTRGRQFAAHHAECVFINGPSKQVIARRSSPTSAAAPRRSGRDPAELVIFTMMTVITAPTARSGARRSLRDYRRYVSEEGALALMSGWTGVDFATLPPDEPVRLNASATRMTSALEAFTTADPGPHLDGARDRTRTPRSAAAARWWSARRPDVADALIQAGSRRPASTASTWPTP